MNLSDIERLTIEHGEGWAYAHVRRVLKLIELIGAGSVYDQQVIDYAAYLHDWGAFALYRQPGVDHAYRSKIIAEQDILPQTDLSPQVKQTILEAIALHDYRNQQAPVSLEALLLREADFLDFLGVIGVVREFAWGPNDLRKCYERAMSKMNALQGRLTLPRAQAIAEQRLAETQALLDRLADESFGFL